MEQSSRIIGFMKILYMDMKSIPVSILIVPEEGGLEMIYPGGRRRKISLSIEKEVRDLDSFIPCENKSLLWKEGQTAAYLDHSGKVHVGSPPEIIKVMKGDLVNVGDSAHITGLKKIIKLLKE